MVCVMQDLVAETHSHTWHDPSTFTACREGGGGLAEALAS